MAPDFLDSAGPSSLGGAAGPGIIVGGFDPGQGGTNSILMSTLANENTTGYAPISMNDEDTSGEKVSAQFEADEFPVSWDEENSRFVVADGTATAKYLLQGQIEYTDNIGNRPVAMCPVKSNDQTGSTTIRSLRTSSLGGYAPNIRIQPNTFYGVLELSGGDVLFFGYAALGASTTTNINFHGASLSLTKLS